MGQTLSTFRSSSVSNSPVDVSVDRASLHAVQITNPGGADAYLQIFNAAAEDVTVGTTAPIKSLLVKAGLQTPVVWFKPITCSAAISIAATTGATNGTAPGSALVVNIDYDE